MLAPMPHAEPPTSLWLRADDPRPGPRPAHTLEQLAEACVGLADADGLRAVSMRRVAQELGTAAASLYRYVAGKDDLVALMVDRVAAEYRYPPLTGDVRTDVLALAEQARQLHRRHPWLSVAVTTTLGPHSMRYLDHMVGALAPTGLDATATMMRIALLSGWVTTFAAQEAAGLSAPTAGGGAEHITAMLAHGDYPHLAGLLASAGGNAGATPVDNDAAFRAGIEALLFGIAPHP